MQRHAGRGEPPAHAVGSVGCTGPRSSASKQGSLCLPPPPGPGPARPPAPGRLWKQGYNPGEGGAAPARRTTKSFGVQLEYSSRAWKKGGFLAAGKRMGAFQNKPPFQFSNHPWKQPRLLSADLLRAPCSDCEDPLALGTELFHAPASLVSTRPGTRQGRLRPAGWAPGAGSPPGAEFAAGPIQRGLGEPAKLFGAEGLSFFPLLPLPQT